MKLSRQEQETVILFNEEEDVATVATYNRRLMSRLIKRGVQPSREDPHGSKTFMVPKEWVVVRPPGKRQHPEGWKPAGFMKSREVAAPGDGQVQDSDAGMPKVV